jgi:branched-chain amino acid transport system ATP-binding protein
MARMGIGFVPDDRRVFADLTVGENLEISAGTFREGGWDKDRVYDFFPALGKIDNPAGRISQRRRAADADHRQGADDQSGFYATRRTDGRAGAPDREHARRADRRLKESGLTVLLAEQNLEVALRLSDRGYVIDNGAIRYHGTREDLSCNEAVRDKYLCV